VLLREQQDAVRRALAALPPNQRDTLLLRHSGYSYAEIAATLEISIGSVGVFLARGERAFRSTYENQEQGR
jgi:RNA polymerase sigma-70 factor (ECF subfamily)